MSRPGTVMVPPELGGIRADRVLAILAMISRSASRQLIEAGLVSVGGVPIGRSTLLAAGDLITYPTPVDSPGLLAENLAFDVVYESAEIIVVNKPPGLVVHPGAGHETGTLVNGLIHRFPELVDLGEDYRWGLVHRLDRDTSGLLLVARTPTTHGFLQNELKKRNVGRTYVGLVAGRLEAATGTIDAPIGRDPARPTRMAIVQDGRPARTHYRRLAEWPEATLVQVELETGRTHQIRVHFSSIGLGLIGDPVYGRVMASEGDQDRIWLHAIRLRFPTEGGDIREVEAPLPADLQRSLRALGDPETGSVDLQ